MSLEIVILAAGQGSRMKSERPKVLHTLAGKTLIEHVLSAADQLRPSAIHVVIGHQADHVINQTDVTSLNTDIRWVQQHQQLGTGHAVAQALPGVDTNSTVLVMAGDVPLIRPETLLPVCALESGINLLTAILLDAEGFGRIIRDPASGAVSGIVEHKDASDEQREIQEINTGIIAARAHDLENWLSQVENKNAQNEYYLPDIISLAVRDGFPVNTITTRDTLQIGGINSRQDLSRLERQFQSLLAEDLMRAGVSLADPQRIDIRGSLQTGRDCFIDVNAIFEGTVHLGDGVHIGPNVVIRNSDIGDRCRIEANSVIDTACIDGHCQLGPFARIRPGSRLRAHSKVGNFVEVKNSDIGKYSKVNHLAYIGDSTLGKNVNIGAGVITCNYDGAYKHQTVIGDDVFVGSDCQLVAPVTIGAGATIGAGSTICQDAPAGKLSLSRSRQIHIDNWQRPVKK